MPTAVMKLYRACKEVFASSAPDVVPPPEDIERLRTVLEKIKPTDVNLSRNMPYFENKFASHGAAPITYLHIYECDKFSVGIFCLPPAAIVPLHNHPGMTVFSKLLFGSMHIKSYDWVENPENTNDTHSSVDSQPSRIGLSKVVVDTVYKAPCGASILYPNSGNLHCFTALTACAVLDVLGPPYNDEEGRHCQYYKVHPFLGSPGGANNSKPADGAEYVRLEEIEKPEDFVILGGKYMGPKMAVR